MQSTTQEDMVKRVDKLDEIKKMLLSTQPACIVVDGRPGVGKSYFLQTLIDDIKQNHFVIFRKIARSENEKIVFVLGELVFKLEDDIKTFAHWNANKEKVIEATESILKWVKNVLKIPEEISVEKIPSYIAGIEREKYERGFIYEFKETLDNLIKYVPDDKRMVIILDQVERIDPKELNLLYDIMEGLSERTIIILTSNKPKVEILSSEIQRKINTEFLTLENFTENETKEMLSLSGIPYDEDLLKKFYQKYKGYPLLQGMALKEMKSKNNYDLDSLPEKVERYFELLLEEISVEDLQIIWILSIFRECFGLDALCYTTKKEPSDIIAALRKKEILNLVRANHCYEPFHSLFSEFVCRNLEKTSKLQFENIHASAAEYYFNKLQNSGEISPGEHIFAMIEAPYHASKAKSPKLIELIRYSSLKIMWGYLEEAKEEFDIAYNLYHKNNDKKGMSSMLNQIGVMHYNWGNPEKALEYYMKALEIDEELKDRQGKASLFCNIGGVYRVWGELEEALKYFKKALVIAEEFKDIQGMAAVFNNIGSVYYDWGKLKKALKYFKKALIITEEFKDIQGKATTLNNIGTMYKEWGKPEKALEYYTMALEIDEELNDIRGKAFDLNNIGSVYQDWGESRKAIEYCQKALAIFEDLKDERHAAILKENIGVLKCAKLRPSIYKG